MKTRQALELQRIKFETERKSARDNEKEVRRKAKADKEKNKILMEKYEQDMIKIRAENIKASISKWETYAKIGIPILVSIGAFITIGWGIIKHKFKTT